MEESQGEGSGSEVEERPEEGCGGEVEESQRQNLGKEGVAGWARKEWKIFYFYFLLRLEGVEDFF